MWSVQMEDEQIDVEQSLRRLTGELQNFQDIVKHIIPPSGEIPVLKGIDIYGETIPLDGLIGGDHIIYVDFKNRYDLEARIRQAEKDGRICVAENLRRCQRMAGIALVDVSGHQITDAMLAGMLHEAFLLGATYELDQFGTITEKLFENLNTRIYNSSSVSKFLTMIYGEISEDDTFKFLSAAHPMPIVFSNSQDRIMDISEGLFANFPPIGTLPSQEDIDRQAVRSVLGFKKKYEINEWMLRGSGDILLLYTDGLADHRRGEEEYFPGRLEAVLQRVKGLPAHEIFEAIKGDLLDFGQPIDDISLVVIKRT
jgi:serine phosphatase RsbU (regulator of sigma subunit)